MLLCHWEHSYNTLNCLRGVDGMQRGENQMSSFRSFERDLNSLFIAHFAH